MSGELSGPLGALVRDLGGIAHDNTPEVLGAKSRDHYWFSPILKQELDGLTAELVVLPRTQDEAPLHLELKRINGQMAIEGIPLLRYTGPEQIEWLSRAFEELGVAIANPHTYFLQNGGMHRIDAAQIAFKRSTDPWNLMNPGKIAGFDQIEGAPGGAGHITASGWAY